MTGIVAFPFDAVSGAPVNTGELLRNTIGALATKPSGRPIGAVSGVIPGASTSGLVSATSSTWTVNPFQAILDLEAGAAAGPYFASVSTTQTGSMNAANSYARIDLLSLTLSDPAEGDGTTTPGVVITYTVGTSSGLAPATPARSFAFAQISVPATGGGSPSTTWVAPFTVAAGGITPAAAGVRPSSPVVGQYIDDATSGLLRWNGTAWVPGGGVRKMGTQQCSSTATGTGAITGCSWTFTPTQSGIARFAMRADCSVGTSGNVQIQMYEQIGGGGAVSVASSNNWINSGQRSQVGIPLGDFALTAGTAYTFYLSCTAAPAGMSIYSGSTFLTYDFTPGATS